MAEVAVAPEPGQLVRVRDRFWVVADVARSAQDADVLTAADQRAEHLLSLASVENDGLGEELQVVWEIEPGVEVIDEATLPTPAADRFDDPDRLEAFLDAIRWGPSPRPTRGRCRRRSAAASPSRTTSSTRWCGRCACRGSTC